MPNFEDAPDGTSSINHTTTPPDFLDELDLILADGSAPLVAAPPNQNIGIGASHVASNPNRRIQARMFSQGEVPNPVGHSSEFPPHPPFIPPLTIEEAFRRHAAALPQTEINTEPYQCSPFPPPPARSPRRRREVSDPDAAIRKDPNAWSLREAVELCKLLEVVLPEAGFHIALTGGLLYKEGRRKDCDLMFYQIRQVEPNYEVLWKYLTVAGVIRSPSYPENGWLVKATYRGKAIDCLFPNAGKKKKTGAANPDCYKTPPTPPTPDMEPPMTATEVNAYQQGVRAAEREIERVTEAQRPTIPIIYRPGTLVRHINGVPEFSAPYTAAELLATPAPAPIPAVAQWEEPF